MTSASLPEHLTDDERSRISVNHCVRESELVAARSLCAQAEAGEWRVEEVGASFRLVRYSDRHPRPVLEKRESYALAAASVRLVPRLLGGIAALEKALRGAWLDAASSRREMRAARDAHDETIRRQVEGKTGPEHELELLARYVTLSAAGDVDLLGGMPESHKTRHLAGYVRYLLSRWAGGVSIARDLGPDAMERAQREVDERVRFRAEAEAQTEELRRQLREAIDKVARGEVPEALKPALREAKKRAKKAEKEALESKAPSTATLKDRGTWP